MTRRARSSLWACWAAVGTALSGGCLGLPSARAAEGELAAWQRGREILEATGVPGGLVVHLGCGDGQLTAALRPSERYVVHGLDRDAGRVDAARARLLREKRYGPVSIEQWTSPLLPYADNLVNLVVAEECGGVSYEEIMRVLAPGGVAYVKAGETWHKRVKPRPPTIDEWTHYLHDAGNNAVARDALVGPPRCLQWLAAPLWLRSHETPSGIQGLVSAAGRIFYFLDEGVVGITDQRLPERWSLICRDAFNGKLLWRRPVEPWGWPEWARDRFEGQDWTTIRGGRTVVPEQNQRRLVAEGERLYATLGYRAGLSILDAATGEVLVTLPATAPAKEILASGGIVLVHSAEPVSDAKRRRGQGAANASVLTAVQGRSGKVLWTRATKPIGSLSLAIDAGRVMYQSAAMVSCLDLTSGQSLWEARSLAGGARTLVARGGTVLLYARDVLEAFDAASGKRLWSRTVPPSAGAESGDLFVAGGLVWRGMVPVNAELKPVGKSADAMAVGFDLRSGEERKRIVARELRSPEHHHRCYRNKATERYIISGMEGAEFLDLVENDHDQNNWLRGACKFGVMPCNGLLYVPADQCFCQPGAKLLGFAAVAAESPSRKARIPDAPRLEPGPAFAALDRRLPAADADDWPTFRHDPARHGASSTTVPAEVVPRWTAHLGGRLTAPVAAGGRVYVASIDAHTVFALDMKSGQTLWSYTAGGRIDSPPTVHGGSVLFGSADGRVYCLRAADGALAWRFLAAPIDCRIGSFDQIESVWPVHGSVLVREGIAYVAAGRSSYLDGGIQLYGLDPHSGKLTCRSTLEGPFPDPPRARDVGFFVLGANTEVLVSEGDYLYLRQKRLTPQLVEVTSPVLSPKGEQDVGLHVFSTSSLLDGSWYNRTFWMYSQRWPGFQLANQAPKSGQILVVDEENTYAVKVFYRRNVHSPMFFPGKEGYLLFADRNANEPQIVGEEGARKPVAWLPQSHIPREGNPGLESPAFGLDKMIGYTRAEAPLWMRWVPIRIRAMVKAGKLLFVAGPPDQLDPQDPYAAFEGRKGARWAAFSASDGQELAQAELPACPVFDGLIAASGRLLVSLEDGSLVCLAGKSQQE